MNYHASGVFKQAQSAKRGKTMADEEKTPPAAQGEGDKKTTPPAPAAPERKAEQDEKKVSRVKELSDENAKRRNEIKELRTELKAVQDQSAADKREKLEAMREAAAVKFGIPTELAARLQGESKADIEKDAETVAKLLPKPAIPATPTRPTSPANPGGGTSGGLTREEIAKMKPQEVMARWAEVELALKQK